MEIYLNFCVLYSAIFSLSYSVLLTALPLKYFEVGSLVNALITSSFGIYKMAQYRYSLNAPLLNTCDVENVPLTLAVCSFVGYLVADLLVTTYRSGSKFRMHGREKVFKKKDLRIVAHHLLFILFTLNVAINRSHCRQCCSTGVALLLYEVSTIPLTIRHITLPGSKMHIFASITMALSFLIFRVIWGAYIQYYTMKLWFTSPEYSLPNITLLMGVSASYSLNLFWMFQILKAALLPAPHDDETHFSKRV